MEWFFQLHVAWQTIIAYAGAIALLVGVPTLLTKLTLGSFSLVIAHPRMWIINKDGKRKRIWNFPYEDEEFYTYMLKMNKDEKLLVTLKNHARFRYIERLFIRMTTKPDVMRTEESILTSTKTVENGKYLVTSVSYKQRDWVLQVKEGKKRSEYTLISVS